MSHRMFTPRTVVKRNLAAVACLFALAGCSDDALAPSELGQPGFDLGSQTATVVTIVHDQTHNAVTEVGFNQTYHANVIVSGGGPTPTGTVTFTEYGDSQCTDLSFEQAPVAIDGTGAAESTTFSIGGPANVSFKTHYSGDANYAAADSNCAPISVVGMLPVIAVEAHNSSHQSVTTVPLNMAVHVKANISGSGPTPTGTITRVWWANGTCSGTPTATEGSIGLVGGNGDIEDFVVAEGTPGAVHSFGVSYSGDRNYKPLTGGCVAVTWGETTQITPVVTVEVHDANHQVVTSVVSGTPVHTRIAVTGENTVPTGTLNVSWYTNGTCSGDPLESLGIAQLSNGQVDHSGGVVAEISAGARSFRAAYSGDDQHSAAAGCAAYTVTEPVEPSPPLVKLGSVGYWRNWRKQYSPAQLQLLIDYVKSNYAPVFNQDQAEGTSDDLTAAKLDAIYKFAKKAPAQQNALAHFSALALDLALTQLAPENGLAQPNSSICTAGETDVSGIAGASALFDTTSPTVGQVLDFVAQHWNGSLTDKRTDWSFNLTQIQLNAVLKTLSGINDGSIVKSAGC